MSPLDPYEDKVLNLLARPRCGTAARATEAGVDAEMHPVRRVGRIPARVGQRIRNARAGLNGAPLTLTIKYIAADGTWASLYELESSGLKLHRGYLPPGWYEVLRGT